NASSIEYGGQPDSKQLGALARQLRTFTEGTNEAASEIIAIRSTLRSAKRVVFLGFAFHPLNMDLLYGHESPKPSRGAPVFATAFGLSESNAELATKTLVTRGGHILDNVRLRRDLTASELLQEYSGSLSFAPRSAS